MSYLPRPLVLGQSEQRNAPLHSRPRSRAATASAHVLKPAFSGRLLWAWRRWQDGGAREYAFLSLGAEEKGAQAALQLRPLTLECVSCFSSHKKYRAALKKEKRKKRRQELARLRDSGRDYGYFQQLENGATWQNPEPPTELRVMEKDRANCPFYSKTGACRFGDRCSRKHNFPTSSPTLLIKSMFTTFGMEQCRRDDYDPDASLEYSEEETYQQFLDFYDDVLPEFKNVGKVIQFKVSCNLEPHLRGNVYVQYQSEEECQAALSLFNGRWYAGRQLQCEFCPVTRWKMAICGLFEIQQCPRGKHCNFLHVFRNPNNEFWEANRDIYLSPDRTGSSFGKSSERRARLGPHDDYYSRRRRRRRRSPGLAHSYKRNGEADRKRSSRHGAKKPHKHRSRSRGRHSSRSRGRKRDHIRGRGSRSHSRRSRSQSSSRSRSHGGRRSGSRD
ncbi:hypothetical protein E5288_WYG005318 [Bos mutus]|uniref:Uncharacterized protein n=1 Tax=Bos mutus TaxID=72004 RepID=A0A6B0SJ71_9CETA|nr:hypothetical protein [Bos mutus]